MAPALNIEQSSIARVVHQGHNAFITGKAGSGKSFLVKTLFAELTSSNRCCQIVCPTGMACESYRNERASTLHSFFGLGVTNQPFHVLVDRATSNIDVRQRARALECLFWDEASMSSAMIVELIHRILCEIREEPSKPFGGVQVVMVGEFKQLRPVPNYFDPGDFMFSSDVFRQTLSHKFELRMSMRHDDSEK